MSTSEPPRPDPSAGHAAANGADALASIVAVHRRLLDDYGAAALARISRSLAFATGAAEPDYPSPWQRPERSYVPGLTTRPWHDPPRGEALDPVIARFEEAAAEVRAEALASLHDRGATSYLDASPGDGARRRGKFAGVDGDDWRVTLFRSLDGDRADVRQRYPATAALLDGAGDELLHRGDAMFSVLAPGALIPAHHDGCNYKLTLHLGLVVPDDCGITVGGESRHWQEGHCLAFDDTFLHSAYNHSERPRICLLVDVWHPDVSAIERKALRALIDATIAAYDIRG